MTPSTQPAMKLDLHSRSEEKTRALGRALGERLGPGDVIGLSGELGTGKTCLVRGIAEGLGIDPERVRSPSFTLMVTYEGGRLPLHHIDLYRLQPTAEDRLALREYLFGNGVCVVEWFEHLGEAFDHLAIEIAYAPPPRAPMQPRSEGKAPTADGGVDERRIRLRAGGDRYRRLIEALAEGEWL